MRLRRVVALFATLAASACNSSSGTTPAPGPTARAPTPIRHIVVLVQENRSFNNVFAGFPGATTAMEGPCKPAKSAPWCKGSHIVKLHSVKLEAGLGKSRGTDIDHSHRSFEIECDANRSHVCAMDGFDLIHYGESGGGPSAKNFPYAFIDRAETKPYWDFAKQYTLSDEMFFTETASSFIAHQMLISGTVQLSRLEWVTDQPQNPPWGCDSVQGDNAPILHRSGKEILYPGIFPCFTWATMADPFDAKHVSWLDYVDQCCQKFPYDFSGGVWNGFRAIKKVFYGPDWRTNISSPNTNIFSDLSNGSLPSVSWVIPALYASDHPASGCNGGPWWVTRVVNAIGTSKYWSDTAIILLWDDWGGWYDSVPPKHINPSALGFRVPMVVISPYAKPNNVSHTQYDFGSILKLMESTFDVGSLGTTDASAASMDDVFDFTQSPIPFKSEPVPKPMPCGKQVTNPAPGADGMRQLIEHDGGVPE